MNLEQARTECERWLEYLRQQERKCAAMQEVAAQRRMGTIDSNEGQRRVRALDNGLTVYDGANLAKAVRALLKATK